MKKLAAFDFDNTIVDKNTDYVAINLLPKGAISPDLKQLYKQDGWTNYMQGIFELLFKHQIKEAIIKKAMKEIPPTSGMCYLIKQLSETLNYDIIIISDSNSYFINTWLDAHGLQENILQVFTNTAKFENDLLKIQMYHLQDHCKLSTKNLCKGQILEDFIEAQDKINVKYEKIVYVGDGSNDFCPILRLKETDLACVREDYKCAKMVAETQSGNPIDATGVPYKIKAEILVWNTAFDILKAASNHQ